MDDLREFSRTLANAQATMRKSNLEPVDTPGHQTVRRTEELIEIIQSMRESADKESRAQHRRFVVETILSLFSIAISSAAAFAAIYSLRLALSCG